MLDCKLNIGKTLEGGRGAGRYGGTWGEVVGRVGGG